MARRVRDDEFPLGRGKVAVRYIDGDALLPLCPQTIRKKREIDGTVSPVDAALLYRPQLVFVNRLGIVEQASDHRRLAIIHAACSSEAQKSFPRQQRFSRADRIAIHSR